MSTNLLGSKMLNTQPLIDRNRPGSLLNLSSPPAAKKSDNEFSREIAKTRKPAAPKPIEKKSVAPQPRPDRPLEPRASARVPEAGVNKNVEAATEPVERQARETAQQAERPQQTAVSRKNGVEDQEQLSVAQALGADQQAMMKFLLLMNEELGVKPDQIVQAMAGLDEQTLMKSPEKTMGEVLNNLGLTGQQRLRATELYQNMLLETADKSMQTYLTDHDQSMDLKVMDPRQLRQEQVKGNIDKMNNQFFVDNQAKANVKRNQIQQQFQQSQNAEKPLMPVPVMATAATKTPVAMTAANQGTAASIPMMDSGLNAAAQGGSEVSSGLSGEQLWAAMEQGSGKSGEGSSQLFGQNQQAAGMPKWAAVGEAPAAAGEASFSSQMFAAGASGTAGQTASTEGAFTQPTLPVNGADKAGNLREVINQAQFVARKGGGEMKIQLQPEGMGQVDLKVAVDKGQVKVEILTENHEAKRMLESTMADLKSSLSAQKLNVDSIKVDLAQNASKEWGQNDSENAGERQQNNAQNFMNQFRQDRHEFNEGLFGRTGYNFDRATEKQDIQPAPVKQNEQSGEARRLHLVA